MSSPHSSGPKATAEPKPTKLPTGTSQKSAIMPPCSLSRAQSEEEISSDQQPPPANFVVGDRVYVGDSKPGLIAFIGNTQFAQGEWAGIALDDAIGKNDGAVNGVRYFQCEPRHGVFCRLSKLCRIPIVPENATKEAEDAVLPAPLPVNGDNINNAFIRRPKTPNLLMQPTASQVGDCKVPPTTPCLSNPISKSLSSSSSNVSKGHVPLKVKLDLQASLSTPGAMSINNKLNIGDRVFVGASKLGTLRYIGPADFAKGEWAGVELDDPDGKNDGAVSGKRYFECRPYYGLFAPIHKVSKISASFTPSPMTRSMGSIVMKRSGSQESVSSLSSVTSSVSRPRVRLGVSGLSNNQAVAHVGQRSSTLNITATTSALQKALKEKEEHIEQLLRERDLERSDVARAAAQVDDAQNQLMQLRNEKARSLEEADESMQQLRSTVQKLLGEKHELQLKLEDERRKVEDLQFQIEEEVIKKDDLESQKEEEEAKMHELEKSLKQEKDKSNKLHAEVVSLKALMEHQAGQIQATMDTQTLYLDQIEELTHKLTQAELKIQTHDSSRLEEGAKTSQVSLELEEKTAKVSELEDFLSLCNKDIKQLQDKLSELKDELDSKNSKQERTQHSVEELTEKLKAREVSSNDLLMQFEILKSENADLQRQLQSVNESNTQLTDEISVMQRQVVEMMKNSGDSSNQLSLLNEQLSQKTRKVEVLQADLLVASQQWHSVNDRLETSRREHEREIELMKTNHADIQLSLVNNLEDVKSELEKTKVKLASVKKDLEDEKENIVCRKDIEVGDLKQELEIAAQNLIKQEIQTQAHKQMLDQITIEKDVVQFEREKLEKHVKRLEAERDGLNTELVHLRVDFCKYQSTYDTLAKSKASIEEKLQDVMDEKEQLGVVITELQKGKEDLQADKGKLSLEKDHLLREMIESQAAMQQKNMMVEELQKEVEKLKQENTQHLEAIQVMLQQMPDSGTIQKQIADQTNLLELLQKQISSKEKLEMEQNLKVDVLQSEIKLLKIELDDNQKTASLLEENVKDLEQERDHLKSQLQGVLEAQSEHDKVLQLNQQLNSEIEMIHERHKQEVETLKCHSDSLQTKVDDFNSLLQSQDQEFMKNHIQISNLENEISLLFGYKSANEQLSKETKELQDKVNHLQTKLSESESNVNIINNKDTSAVQSTDNNDQIAKLKEDYKTIQEQLEFLNSVIIDLQRKNDELKARLQAMEEGVTNGADDTLDLTTPTKRAAPRVFCDICDMFDLHDTEDCPLQAMPESPPPSRYHGDRHQMRPYCDICEEFHPPCPGLSIKKVVESSAEPIDPKSKVADWVKKVESITLEPEKVFDNDGEFFHVQRGPLSAAFRDSGYYDEVLGANLGAPTKPCLKALGDSTSLAQTETTIRDSNIDAVIDKIERKVRVVGNLMAVADLLSKPVNDEISCVAGNDLPPKVEMRKCEDIKCTESEPDSLAKHTYRPHTLDIVNKPAAQRDINDDSENTPSSRTSLSDSEYQSGNESPDFMATTGVDTPEMESSVDTAEVFHANNLNEMEMQGKTDANRPENCMVS